VPEWIQEWKKYEDGPIKMANLSNTLDQGPYWHDPILQVKGLENGIRQQAITLAEVIAPDKPIILTGRNLVTEIPEAERVLAGNMPAMLSVAGPGAAGDNAVSKDLNWATVFIPFDRAAQIKQFEAAGYPARRRAVLFLWPELQRRSRRDGNWSDWESVVASLPYDRPANPEVTNDPGLNPGPNDAVSIQGFSQLVLEAQLRIMRPEFPPVISGKPWSIPVLPGIKPDDFTAEGDSRWNELLLQWDPNYVPPETNAAGRGGPGQINNLVTEGMSIGRQVNIVMDEAQKLMHRDPVAAQTLLDDLLQKGNLTIALQGKIFELKKKIQEKIDAQQTAADRRQAFQQRPGMRAGSAGIDAASLDTLPARTTLWAHDTGPVPGAIYQYRARVVLYNVYAGLPDSLADAADANIVEIAGAWSEPADPVEIQPDVHFFVRKSGRDARVAMYKWYKGQWVKDEFTVTIGSKIGGPGRADVKLADDLVLPEDIDFTSDYTVVDLDFNRELPPGVPGRGRNKTALSLVYLDSQNQLRERFDVLDRNDRLQESLKQEVTQATARPRDPADPGVAPPGGAGAGNMPFPPGGGRPRRGARGGIPGGR
jgi:hypothetical protein